jgi:plasmid stability protein
MPSITIRNVPEHLHERLARCARQHGRSINREVIHLIEQALSGKTEPPRSRLGELRALRAASPPLNLDPDELKASMRSNLP